MAITESQLSDHERLLVRPRRACHLLDCGITRLYELLEQGELESFLDGRSRKITIDSIHRYIAKRLAVANKKNPVPRGSAKNVLVATSAAQNEPAKRNPQTKPRGRMRPRDAGAIGDDSVPR